MVAPTSDVEQVEGSFEGYAIHNVEFYFDKVDPKKITMALIVQDKNAKKFAMLLPFDEMHKIEETVAAFRNDLHNKNRH